MPVPVELASPMMSGRIVMFVLPSAPPPWPVSTLKVVAVMLVDVPPDVLLRPWNKALAPAACAARVGGRQGGRAADCRR